MKKKQRTVSKIVALTTFICLLSSPLLYGKAPYDVLEHADSLFLQKRYTQSFELYKDLLDKKMYTESTLLKMAFIQEGLGHITRSLYYLNLYYLVSGDERAFQKITKMADQNQLQGYSPDAFMRVRYLLYRNYMPVSLIMGILVAALLGILFYQKRRHKKTPYLTFIALLLGLGLLGLHVNFSDTINRGIVAADTAYLMKAPSAGAPVVDRVGEGNQLAVTGKEDVWLRVRWMDREAYIKQNQLLLVEL